MEPDKRKWSQFTNHRCKCIYISIFKRIKLHVSYSHSICKQKLLKWCMRDQCLKVPISAKTVNESVN